MNSDAFLTKLADVLEVNAGVLSEDYRLTEDNWDSMAVLATMALIDETYSVTVPAKALTACKSIGAVEKLVRQSLTQVNPHA